MQHICKLVLLVFCLDVAVDRGSKQEPWMRPVVHFKIFAEMKIVIGRHFNSAKNPFEIVCQALASFRVTFEIVGVFLNGPHILLSLKLHIILYVNTCESKLITVTMLAFRNYFKTLSLNILVCRLN